MNKAAFGCAHRLSVALACLLFFALVASALAVAETARTDGGFDGGGGDPLANEFLEIAQQLQRAQELKYIHLGVQDAALKEKIHSIRSSLEGQSPLVMFPGSEVVFCFGAPKLGCVDSDGVIRIARLGWERASQRDRVELTAMELVKSLHGADRYRVANEAAEVLGGEGRFNAEELYQAVNAAQRFQPLFNTTCQLPTLNAAMRVLGAGYRYPQFDLRRNDDFQNFTSVSFDQKHDPQAPHSTAINNQVLFVSAIWNFDHNSIPTVYPIGDKMIERAGKKGERQIVYVFYKAQSARSTPNPCWELQRSIYNQAPRSEGDNLSAPLTWHANSEGPASIPAEWLKKESFFRGCQRDVLNVALERAALDTSFEKFTGNTYRTFQLLSAYRMENLKEPGTETFFINLDVGTFGFSTPYIFRITARETGDSCSISEVKMR